MPSIKPSVPPEEFMLRIVIVVLVAVAFCLIAVAALLYSEHAARLAEQHAGYSVPHEAGVDGFDSGYNDWVCPFVYPTPYAWDSFWFGPVNGATVDRFRYLNDQYCRSDNAPVT